MEQDIKLFRYKGLITGIKYIKREKYLIIDQICFNGSVFRDGKYSIYLKCPLLKTLGVRQFSDLIDKYIFWDQQECYPSDECLLYKEDHAVNITLA